jgi:hypothetical protein
MDLILYSYVLLPIVAGCEANAGCKANAGNQKPNQDQASNAYILGNTIVMITINPLISSL